MRVLSIDPAIRHTGYAILEGSYQEARALDYGTLHLAAKLRQSECLACIYEKVDSLIRQWQPDELAIEAIIHVQSLRTAIIMGSARGVVLAAAAAHQKPVMEYPPSTVKLASVGKGAAQKQQVAFMVRAMLGLTETPESDAADALAIGYAHLVANDPLRAQMFSKKKHV